LRSCQEQVEVTLLQGNAIRAGSSPRRRGKGCRDPVVAHEGRRERDPRGRQLLNQTGARTAAFRMT